MANEKLRIIKKYLILCEGKDAYNFMINYLESDALKEDRRFGNDIQQRPKRLIGIMNVCLLYEN